MLKILIKLHPVSLAIWEDFYPSGNESTSSMILMIALLFLYLTVQISYLKKSI